MAPGGRPEGDLGVVELLRLPDGVLRAWQRSAAWFTAQPLLARLFIGLAALDVVVRALGVVGPSIVLDIGAPVGILYSFFPHDLLILLPALVVIRRPTATDDTPNVVDGAILVALAELLSHPTGALAGTIGSVGPAVLVALGATLVTAVGWVWVGRGLASLNPAPSPNAAGWANLAALGIVATAGVTAVIYVAGPGVDYGDEDSNRLLAVFYLAQILAPLAIAYLGRHVIRGFEDERRPEMALRLGAAAVLLAAGLGLVVNVISLLARSDVAFAQSLAGVGGWDLLYWLATGGAISLLVIAFGIGLADPAVPGEAVEQHDNEAVTLEQR